MITKNSKNSYIEYTEAVRRHYLPLKSIKISKTGLIVHAGITRLLLFDKAVKYSTTSRAWRGYEEGNTALSFLRFLFILADISFYTLKVPLCKLNNNNHMIASTQITNTEIFAFTAVLVFRLLSRNVLFINKKDNTNC